MGAPSAIEVLMRGAIPKTVGVLEEGGFVIAPPIVTNPSPKVDHCHRAGIPVPHPFVPNPSTPLKEANALWAHPKASGPSLGQCGELLRRVGVPPDPDGGSTLGDPEGDPPAHTTNGPPP